MHLAARLEAVVARAAQRIGIPPAAGRTALEPMPVNSPHGHYRCTLPVQHARRRGDDAGLLAARLADAVAAEGATEPLLGAVAGVKGIVNVSAAAPALAAALAAGPQSPLLSARSERLAQQTVLVDFSSPNVAKAMHVGHLRSTIIGDSICRVFEEAQTGRVLRVSHVGDWGTQFGMLLALRRELEAPASDLGGLHREYQAARARFDADPAFRRTALAAVVELQTQSSPAAVADWEQMCTVTRDTNAAIYERLGVRLTEIGESRYAADIPPMLRALEEQGLVVESEGALCLFPNGREKTPLMLCKSDGGYTYDTTDLAALRRRGAVDQCDQIVYVTDMGQRQHFSMVFAAGQQAGWPGAGAARHVGLGLVLGSDKKRLRTRAGEATPLLALLDEAEVFALQSVRERNKDGSSDAEQHGRIARAIGINCVKYADLRQGMDKSYVFAFERMLDVRGNTGMYLLYTRARMASIVRKSASGLAAAFDEPLAGRLVQPLPAETAPSAATEIERNLLVAVARYPEVIERAARDLQIHRVAEYAYSLCTLANEMIASCRVVGDPREAERVRLLVLVEGALFRAVKVLGFVDVPDWV